MLYADDDAEAPGEEPEYEGFELERYLAMWRECADDYAEPREQHYADERYYDGDVKGTGWGQWTQDELNELADRAQPPAVRNLIKRKINAIAGVEQRSRSEPRAHPRTPKDQYAAEICTDTLRYIKEQTRWSSIKAHCFIDALKVGFAAVEIGGAEDSVPISPIGWKDFFFDPRSRRPDYSDARYLGVAKWLDADIAKSTYAPLPQKPDIPPPPLGDPAAMEAWQAYASAMEEGYQRELARIEQLRTLIDATSEGSIAGEIQDDRPAKSFGDRTRKRVFVVDMWHREPKHGWYRCVFTGKGKLHTEPASMIEADEFGRKQTTHPIKAFSLYVSSDLWRYGEVRDMRPVQDELNKRLSKALHILTTNQVVTRAGNYGPDGDKEKTRAEVARPDGFIEVQDVQSFKIEKNIDLAQGQQRLGEEAREFLEATGPNPQLQGEQGRAQSGRAVLALQQAGLGQLGPIFDALHDWELRCYRAMWSRVQQFWQGPMYVRVTDDKNAARFAAVNGAPVLDEQGQPVPSQQAMMQAPPNGAYPAPIGHNGGPPIDAGEFETGPMLAELDMDVIIDRAPEAATLQAEQFEEMARLAGTGLFNGLPPAEVARIMVTASSLPNKSELLDAVDKAAQAAAQPNPEQQMSMQMMMGEIAKLRAEIEDLRAGTDKKRAETAKIGAEARMQNAEATMAEIGSAFNATALGALSGFGSPVIDPLAAAAPGAEGLPLTQGRIGPPPI